MDISQENGSTANSVTVNSVKYIADGWMFAFTTTSAFTLGYQRPQAGAGSIFPYYLQLWSGGGAWSITGAGDACFYVHRFEGTRWSRLAWGTANAVPVSIGFWGYASSGGTFCVAFRTYSGSRSYVRTFNLPAMIWTWVTMTIPGDTGGSWATDTSVGAQVAIGGASGATGQAPSLNTWLAANYYSHASCTNFLQATNYILAIATFGVWPGLAMPPSSMAQSIMRPASEELTTCYRYLQFNRARMPGYLYAGPSSTNNYWIFNHQCYVPMRATPTVSATATSFAMENIPWQTAMTFNLSNLTTAAGSTIDNTGGEFQASGTTNVAAASVCSPASINNGGIFKYDARL
jgi:hypothetical protein